MSTLLDGNGDTLTVDQRRELAGGSTSMPSRTSRLLADLTSLDRLLHGSNEPCCSGSAVAPLVERVVNEVDVADRTLGVVPDPDACAAMVDPVLTERVVDNLVTNALKHTPVGSRVEISIEAGERDVVLHVDDDGPGIAAPLRAALFDAYVRGDDSAVRPGSGMGLFLVRTFAEVQGGMVFCDESPLGGARFSVVLPDTGRRGLSPRAERGGQPVARPCGRRTRRRRSARRAGSPAPCRSRACAGGATGRRR